MYTQRAGCRPQNPLHSPSIKGPWEYPHVHVKLNVSIDCIEENVNKYKRLHTQETTVSGIH